MNRLRTQPLRPLATLPRAGTRLVLAACAAITLAGCGSQVAGPATGHTQTASTTPPAASPRQRAVADAARIIADFPRPAGAVRTGLIASLSSPGVGMGTTDVATATRWWRVPGQPQAVLSWVRAHVPAGFTWTGSAGSAAEGSSSAGLVESWTDTPDLSTQQRIAVEIQKDVLQEAPFLPLGQYFAKTAHRRNLDGIIKGVIAFWNVRRI